MDQNSLIETRITRWGCAFAAARGAAPLLLAAGLVWRWLTVWNMFFLNEAEDE